MKNEHETNALKKLEEIDEFFTPNQNQPNFRTLSYQLFNLLQPIGVFAEIAFVVG